MDVAASSFIEGDSSCGIYYSADYYSAIRGLHAGPIGKNLVPGYLLLGELRVLFLLSELLKPNAEDQHHYKQAK
jgi:hypothetical protein